MKGISILHWAPRALGVIYAAFIAVLAMEAWGTGQGFWEELAAFVVQLMPAYFAVAALAVAWRNPWVGGILFILLATVFGVIFGWQETSQLLLIALPPTAIGLLFMCDGCITRTELQPRI